MSAPQLGVAASDTPGGVQVTGVQPQSGAAQAGLQPGDVIVALEGTRVSSVAELRERLGRHATGDFVRVTVLRDGGRLELSVLLTPTAATRLVPGATPGAAPGRGGQARPGQQQVQPQNLFGGLLTPDAVASAATEALLDRLADLVAERLASRGAVTPDVTPTPTPAASAPTELELTTFFGRVAAIDGDSVRLDGTLGQLLSALDAAVGDVHGSGLVDTAPGGGLVH